jgi:hypothetical protein
VHSYGLVYSGIEVAAAGGFCAFDNYSRVVGPKVSPNS